MLQELQIPIQEREHKENPTKSEFDNSQGPPRLYLRNPGVGGLCKSCVKFSDCTYPKSAHGSWFCDEYSR
jgi:hypothetical protein